MRWDLFLLFQALKTGLENLVYISPQQGTSQVLHWWEQSWSPGKGMCETEVPFYFVTIFSLDRVENTKWETLGHKYKFHKTETDNKVDKKKQMNGSDEKWLQTRKKENGKKEQMKPITWKGSKCYGKQISEISRRKISKKWDAPENCRLGEGKLWTGSYSGVSNKDQKMKHVFKLAPTRENDYKYGKNI